MIATTIQKFIGASPRKLRLVADMVRKMNPNQAMDILSITRKTAARDLLKAINTAISNAKQGGMDLQAVVFSRIEINEGPKMKRFRAGTRGRARPYVKKMSHIKIILTDDLNLKSQNSNVKTDVKTEKQKNKKENK